MAENKHPIPEVEISDNKVSDVKRSSGNVKIAIIRVVTVVLLLASVISVAVYFTLTPTRLAEVNLEEGEILSYRVRQDIQIQGEDLQKGISHFH